MSREERKRKKTEASIPKNNKEILPIRCYDERIRAFVLEDGSYLDLVEMMSDDLANMSDGEVEFLMLRLERFLKTYADDIKLIAMNFPTDASRQLRAQRRTLERTSNPIQKYYVERSISETQRAASGTDVREYYFMIFSKNIEEHENHLKQLSVFGDGIRPLKLSKKAQIIYRLYNQNSYLAVDDFNEEEESSSAWRLMKEEQETVPSKGKKGKKKEKQKERVIPMDYPLFEYMQPQGGITFREPNYVITGDGYTKVLHIYKLPTVLKDYWLENLLQVKDAVTTIDISTRDKYEVQKNINRALQEEASRERHAKDYEEAYDAHKRQQLLQAMYDEVQSMGEVVKMLHMRIFVSGKSLVMLEQKCGEIAKALEASEFMPTVLLNEGKREFMSLTQSYTRQMEERFAIPGLSLMTGQIAGGYAFCASNLMDDTGRLLGFTGGSSGVVFFDEFMISERRKHYNSVVIGDMGSGKSTLLKKRFLDRAAMGDFVRCFDISGEFSALTRRFGGKIIRCDGTSGMLNPLEILRAADDEGTNFLRHIQKVRAFYECLIPNSTEEILIRFTNLLREFYQSIQLVPEAGRITGLPAARYPVFSDLLDYTEHKIALKIEEAEKEGQVKKELLLDEIRELSRIKEGLEDIVKTNGQIFDGHTTIDNITDEKIVTFDISTIKDLGNVFAAQLFNMVYFCWDNCVSNGTVMKELYESGQIAFDKVTRFLIIVDESHRWINTRYSFILERIITMLREMRKYFAGMMMASQSFRDYISEGTSSKEIEQLKVVFELTQYKFIFKQDSSVLPLIDKIFGNVLSPWQREKIPTLEKGETILSISGDRNLYFKVWLSKEDEKLFAGGV